jgi:hypothetical protein
MRFRYGERGVGGLDHEKHERGERHETITIKCRIALLFVSFAPFVSFVVRNFPNCRTDRSCAR